MNFVNISTRLWTMLPYKIYVNINQATLHVPMQEDTRITNSNNYFAVSISSVLYNNKICG